MKWLTEREYNELEQEARIGRRLSSKSNGNNGSGCIIVLIVIGLIIYYPTKWYKEWTMNPLEFQVKVPVANFRSLPSKSGKIIAKARKGETFIQLNDSSIDKIDTMWVLGIIGTDTGWIHRDLLEQDIWK